MRQIGSGWGFGWVLAFLTMMAACSTPGSEDQEVFAEADLIIVGENILTMDETDVEAVAVTGEVITATGTRADILRYQGEETRLIELGDMALAPGFIDSHSHITAVAGLVGLANLSSPPVGEVTSVEALIDALGAKIEEDQIAEGDWVVGYGYDDSLLEENRHPTRQDLDRVSTRHPVAILHVSGHLAVANSLALEAFEITSETVDPPGGHIQREAGGDEPNGVLEETAAQPVLARTFIAPPETLPAKIGAAMGVYASEGFTTVQDGASNFMQIAALGSAIAEGAPAYPLDLVMFPHIAWIQGCQGERVHTRDYVGGMRIGGVKFTLDGSPQGRTAFLTEPYTLQPDGKSEDYRGYPSMPPDVVNAKAAECLENGVPMLMHANGDAAIDMVLEAVGGAFEEGEMTDHRTVIIHAQLMREDQLGDVKTLGLVPSYYSAHPFFWGDWHAQIFGEARASRISPIRDTIDRDIPFVIHNDAPIIPPVAMRLMDITVNRVTRSGRILGPEQRATPYEALYAMTMGGAYQYFEEDNKGSITPGKQADLVILETNPLTAPVDTLADIDVVETIARGRTVYQR